MIRTETMISSRTERRGTSRFPMECALRVRVLSRQGEASREAGGNITGSAPSRGQTVNMSSTGVLFTADCELTPGRRVEVSISWPAQLNDKCPLKLVARGRVVRVEGAKVAIEIQQYEFRTAPGQADSRVSPGAIRSYRSVTPVAPTCFEVEVPRQSAHTEMRRCLWQRCPPASPSS